VRNEVPSEERLPLRAADWRFLLPQPERGRFRTLVLLGGAAGIADRIAEIGIADAIIGEIPPKRCADAVVALHGARATPREIADCLLPGGAVYCEIDRRSPRHLTSTPNRVRRSLRRVGLTPTGAYVVGPSLYQPRVFVPLDAPGALAWYLRTLFNPWTPAVALAEAVLRTVVAVGRGRVAALAPHFAVTAVAGETRIGATSVFGISALSAGEDSKTLHPLLLTATHQETLSQRIVVLPFAPDSRQPLAVVKVSKVPMLNATLEAEQRSLTEVRRRLDASMRNTVPRPLGVKRSGDVTVAIETYCPGQSLQRLSFRWGRPLAAKLDDLRLATTWLAEFHRQTTARRVSWGPAERAQFVEAPFRAYSRAFGATERERLLFAAGRRFADSVQGASLPIVLRKPDFFASNIVRFGSELSILDWENPHLGPALCDLLRFLAPWSDAVARAQGDRSYDNFRKLFFSAPGADPVRDAAQDAIAQYTDHLSVDRRVIPLLLVYTWVDRALHHFQKQRLQGERPRDTRAGNRHIGRVTILAEQAEQLFPAPPMRYLADSA
jgi:aminoglycoside phosphotransferase (APT) family kinase protein